MKRLLVFAALLAVTSLGVSSGDVWEEGSGEVLIRSERGAGKKACRYRLGKWSPCDSATNTSTRTLTLKKGDPAECAETKTVQKKCKKTCRFQRGSWSECDVTLKQMTRTDTLKSGSDPSCEQTRKITRRCRGNVCRYEKMRTVSWSECDTESQTMSKVRKLVSGDEQVCPKTKVTTKPCKKFNRKKKAQEKKKKKGSVQSDRQCFPGQGILTPCAD